MALREDATNKLKALETENFANYVAFLCQELANAALPGHVRMSAGLMIKNSLSSRDVLRQAEMSSKWLNVDANFRNQIKQAVLISLTTSDTQTASTVAQLIAAIASIELPQGQWRELIRILLEQITTTESDNIKQACLTTVGYICEAMDPNVLEGQSDAILTAVAHGARKEEPNVNVRRTAIKALLNSLEFVDSNFEKEASHCFATLSVLIVCEATQSEDSDLQVAAFECLVKIMCLYYDKMIHYMGKALYGLTMLGMRHDNPKVVLQAVEFWSSVAEIEYDLPAQRQDAQDAGEPLPSFHDFCTAAIPQIVPILLWLMTKKEEDEDEDEWNAVPMFLNLMNDPVIQVKDAASWTISRISQQLVNHVTPQDFPKLISAVLAGLNDNPRVATNCAWCIINLAEQTAPAGDTQHPPTSALTPYFDGMITALSQTGERSSQDPHLRASVYEAISILVQFSANDCFPSIHTLTTAVLSRLNETAGQVNQLVGSDDRRTHFEYQANLCSVLTSIIRRVDVLIKPFADSIMQTVLTVASTASKSSTVMEDVFMVVSAIANNVDTDFNRYVDAVVPFLCSALENAEEYQLCVIAIGLVGDMCRAINDQILPYCEQIMTRIAALLMNPEAHQTIKPACLSAMGDMALAIGGQFEIYLGGAMGCIQNLSTAMTYMPTSTAEQTDFLDELREGIAEAYVGILQGLKAGDKSLLLQQYAHQIFMFLETCCVEQDRPESLTRSVFGLLGDLAEVLPVGPSRQFFAQEWISESLKAVKTDRKVTTSTREVCRWAREMVRRQTSQ
eukprot:jgi/Hompol1/1965/HPOL_002808-RA